MVPNWLTIYIHSSKLMLKKALMCSFPNSYETTFPMMQVSMSSVCFKNIILNSSSLLSTWINGTNSMESLSAIRFLFFFNSLHKLDPYFPLLKDNVKNIHTSRETTAWSKASPRSYLPAHGERGSGKHCTISKSNSFGRLVALLPLIFLPH